MGCIASCSNRDYFLYGLDMLFTANSAYILEVGDVSQMLLEHGHGGDLKRKDVRNKVKSLLQSDLCIGVWFGFPCGTLTRARRNDGKGAPPLRGNCPKTLKGLPNLKPGERKRVLAANKLLC